MSVQVMAWVWNHAPADLSGTEQSVAIASTKLSGKHEIAKDATGDFMGSRGASRKLDAL